MELTFVAKRKFRFNFVDVLVVILIVAVGFGAYSFIKNGFFTAGTGDSQAVIRCVFRTSDINDEFATLLTTNSVLYIDNGDTELGTVKAVEVRPAVYVGESADGVIMSEIEGKSCLYVTVEINAAYDGKSYGIGDTKIYVGAELEAISPKLAFNAECISLEKIG